MVMTGGDLSSENIRNSYLEWDLFSFLSSISGLDEIVLRGKIGIVLRPVPQRVPQGARASSCRGAMILDFHTSWVKERVTLKGPQCRLYNFITADVFLQTQCHLTRNIDGKWLANQFVAFSINHIKFKSKAPSKFSFSVTIFYLSCKKNKKDRNFLLMLSALISEVWGRNSICIHTNESINTFLTLMLLLTF